MASRIYELRTTIKGQILAYFILEFTPRPSTPCDLLDRWALNTDGASNIKGSRIGIILKTAEGSIIEQSFTLGFPATNNEVEYKVVTPISKWLRPSESPDSKSDVIHYLW